MADACKKFYHKDALSLCFTFQIYLVNEITYDVYHIFFYPPPFPTDNSSTMQSGLLLFDIFHLPLELLNPMLFGCCQLKILIKREFGQMKLFHRFYAQRCIFLY